MQSTRWYDENRFGTVQRPAPVRTQSVLDERLSVRNGGLRQEGGAKCEGKMH